MPLFIPPKDSGIPPKKGAPKKGALYFSETFLGGGGGGGGVVLILRES